MCSIYVFLWVCHVEFPDVVLEGDRSIHFRSEIFLANFGQEAVVELWSGVSVSSELCYAVAR